MLPARNNILFLETNVSSVGMYCLLFKPGTCQAHAWFLKIVSVSVSVCPTPGLLIASDVMWHDMDTIRLVKHSFYSCYMATVVVIVNGRGFGIDTCHGN